MRKKLLALFLVVITLLPPGAQAREKMDYLILVYLCGTDLESNYGAATDDLIEMLDAGLPEDLSVSVLVQTGGTQEWQNEIVNSNTAQRFLIADGLYDVDDNLGQLNMGDSETLYDFVNFAMSEYPAEKYALVLWDHGAGSTGGVCYDEITDDALSTQDIHSALSAAEAHFEFIGFDACLMSTIEMASSLRPFAKYMVASEELEPGSGWAYDAWLGALAKEPSMDGLALGKVIVDSFIESALAADPNDYVTLSVTDLGALGPLTESVDDLGNALRDEMSGGQYAPISRARAGMRAFGDFADLSSDMVDIGAMAEAYAAIAPEHAKAVEKAIEQAVVYNRSSANIESASGLAVLMPYKTKAYAGDYLPEYDALNILPDYSAFINDYVYELSSGSHSFAETPIVTQSIAEAEDDEPGWLQAIVQGTEANQYGDTAYTAQLSEDDIINLSYVEASLLQDAYDEVGDEYGDEVYFDYGLMQDVYVEWETGTIYGLFDDTWPTLEGQMVPMFDQIVTPAYTRSIIPATVNGVDQYLLVVFNDDNPGGLVVGYTEGYDENGNPARGYEKLSPGDTVSPLYDLIYWDEDEALQVEPYEGDEIIVGDEPLDFCYDDVEAGIYNYAFCLNDVYGGYAFTDFWELEYE